MRDLAAFTTEGYDKGRSRVVQALWFATMNLLFMPWFWPARWRVLMLRLFGANIGTDVLIRHRVRVLWPWKLSVGDRCWIGEGAWILNLEPVRIGHDVCVSQEALLCTGSHDYRRPDFRYRNAPITIGDGSWVAARALVLPGVRVGAGAVVAAGAVVSTDVADETLLTLSGARPIEAAK
jgi:putative colanic acid biosynthesis acetyltransferase WcaF